MTHDWDRLEAPSYTIDILAFLCYWDGCNPVFDFTTKEVMTKGATIYRETRMK